MGNFIKRLFVKNKQPTSTNNDAGSSVVDSASTQPVQTAPLQMSREDLEKYPFLKPEGSDRPTTPRRLDVPQLIVGCGHSVGRQRDHNEDALYTLTTNLISDSTKLPFGLFIVADGMGGHQHGEKASGIAVRAMANYILRKLYIPLFGHPASQPAESLQEIMEQGAFEAHQAILRESLGGGTTLTGILVLSDQMTITHVGDSRAYVIHPDGHIQIITHDHSLVKRLEELGQLTAAEAAIHPQRNVLYRALGQGDPFEPDVITYPVPNSGHLLICSDGLWGVVSEQDIINIVSTTQDPQQACQVLVDYANASGGPDNITVILVRMP